MAACAVSCRDDSQIFWYRLKDLVVRTETNKLVTDLVDFDRVQSLLLMILYRRRYLAQREQARMEAMGGPGECF